MQRRQPTHAGHRRANAWVGSAASDYRGAHSHARRAAGSADGVPTPSAATTESGIAQGLTPEGYHVLGQADAPVTIVTYSDFL
jgi:protein-disulfide isomerase